MTEYNIPNGKSSHDDEHFRADKKRRPSTNVEEKTDQKAHRAQLKFHHVRMRLAAQIPPPLDYKVLPSLRLPLRRRIKYAACGFEISISRFLARFFHVCCTFWKFLASALMAPARGHGYTAKCGYQKIT